MKMYKSRCLFVVTAVVLAACGEKAATTTEAVPPPPVAAQPAPVTAAGKPASVVEQFVTSSMPDTFTIPKNTCEQGKPLQELKKKLQKDTGQ